SWCGGEASFSARPGSSARPSRPRWPGERADRRAGGRPTSSSGSPTRSGYPRQQARHDCVTAGSGVSAATGIRDRYPRTRGTGVEARQYTRLLRRNWLLFLGALVLSVGLALLLFVAAPGQYRSTVTFLVTSSAPASSPSDTYQAELLSQSRATVYASLASGP